MWGTEIMDLLNFSDRCLLEYEELLMCSEMQASNLSKTCEGVRFSECGSELDDSSDEWSSDSESFSRLPGDENSEYHVLAGSKPLSLIIRKCNTPPVACSPNAPAVEEAEERKEERESEITDSALASSESQRHSEVPSLSDNCVIETEQPIIASSDVGAGDLERASTEEVCSVSRNCFRRSSEINVDEKFNQDSSVCESRNEVCTVATPDVADVNVCNGLRAESECISDEREENCDAGEHPTYEPAQKSKNAEEACSDVQLTSPNASVKTACMPVMSSSATSTVCDANDNEAASACDMKGEICEAAENEDCEINQRILSNEPVTNNVSVNCKQNEDELEHSISSVNMVTKEKNVPFHCTSTEDLSCDWQVASSPVKSMSDLPHSELDSICDEQASSSRLDVTDNFSTPRSVTSRTDISCSDIKSSATPEQDSLLNDSVYPSSPLLFSSDDEYLDDTRSLRKGWEAQDSKGAPAPAPALSGEHQAALRSAARRLRRLQELLTGVPPPPSVTFPPYAVTDMLRLLQENEGLLTTGRTAQDGGGRWQEQAQSAEWPRCSYLQCPGAHCNLGPASEEYEKQLQKLQERCVGSETASSCCLWAPSAPRQRGPKKGASSSTGNGAGPSPGRRLSHLARRRKTFSSSSLLPDSKLPSVLSSSGAEHRMILVETKNKMKKERKSSQKKKNGINRTENILPVKLNSSKRALFQSPTEDRRRTPRSKFRSVGSAGEAQRSRRALFMDSGAPQDGAAAQQTRSRQKRPLEEADGGEGRCKVPRRSLFTDPASPGAGALPRPERTPRKAEQAAAPPVAGAMSSSHKKKLLWAVAEALKQRGVGLSHPQFRAHASALASRCRSHVPALLAQLRGSGSGGTSDRMLALALRFVGDVVKQPA